MVHVCNPNHSTFKLQTVWQLLFLVIHSPYSTLGVPAAQSHTSLMSLIISDSATAGLSGWPPVLTGTVKSFQRGPTTEETLTALDLSAAIQPTSTPNAVRRSRSLPHSAEEDAQQKKKEPTPDLNFGCCGQGLNGVVRSSQSVSVVLGYKTPSIEQQRVLYQQL
ncbi:hypothetical protein JOB18_027724 [Solea senegalensis]|uniref:Uncharacterized protein n=1 Tax=Solea senegalensis TaxID=28829 RepID=A0AAV6REP8_SOLSE|nr:hypothetical protein JOB18_027724 [Solea senegalensis]